MKNNLRTHDDKESQRKGQFRGLRWLLLLFTYGTIEKE